MPLNKSMILPDYPFRVEFEVTHTCNLDCSYCYAKPFTSVNPSIDKLEYLFNKTKNEADPFEVILLGGEPFARRDAVEVIETAVSIFKQGISMSTNGTLLKRLSEEKLVRLKKIIGKNVSLQVSFDSINPEVNERTRGKTRDTVEGLDILERCEIPFSIGIVLTVANKDDVSNTTRYLLSKYRNLRAMNLEPLQPSMQLGTEYFTLRLGKENMVDIYNSVINNISNTNRKDVRLLGVFSDQCVDSRDNSGPLLSTYDIQSCTAGLLRAGVFVDGNVTQCVDIRDNIVGNLYTESWKEIWARSKALYAQRTDDCTLCFKHVHRDAEKRGVNIEIPMKQKVKN